MRLFRLTLSAPLQSWGADSKWDNRETLSMPTKSAVIGLLGCCLGYPRGDSRLNQLDQALHMAVRADRPGRIMTDFHTVQGTNGILLNAEGGKRGSDTIITPRHYLQDARFTVFIWGEEATVRMCYEGLKHPQWAAYLGRKSCVPTMPLIPEWVEADSINEAVAVFTDEDRKHLPPSFVQVEIDLLPGEQLQPNEHLVKHMDSVVRADLNEYHARRVRAFYVKTVGDGTCT